MTIVYNDYYQAYNSGMINLNDVILNVKLVLDTYIPDITDKPNDVQDYIIASLNTFEKDAVMRDSMSKLIEDAKASLLEGIKTHSGIIMEEVNMLIADETKRMNINNAITQANSQQTNYDFWRILQENGITQLVVEAPTLDILCWCEPLI